MKSLVLVLIIVLFSITGAPAQNWYTEQTQHGWAPNYGLGSSNGTGFGSVPYQSTAPQGAWQNEYSPSYDPNYSWEAPSQGYQAMPQDQTTDYSYGIPTYDKPLAPCGPYYNKRAIPGC